MNHIPSTGGFLVGTEGLSPENEERDALIDAMIDALYRPHSDHCRRDCRIYRPGHVVHFIQARLSWESPEFYRRAVVESVDGHVCVLRFDDDTTDEMWHHRGLKRRLPIGTEVQLHTKYHVLRLPREADGGYPMLSVKHPSEVSHHVVVQPSEDE